MHNNVNKQKTVPLTMAKNQAAVKSQELRGGSQTQECKKMAPQVGRAMIARCLVERHTSKKSRYPIVRKVMLGPTDEGKP
jgi:hypothetical protein